MVTESKVEDEFDAGEFRRFCVKCVCFECFQKIITSSLNILRISRFYLKHSFPDLKKKVDEL